MVGEQQLSVSPVSHARTGSEMMEYMGKDESGMSRKEN